MSSSLTDLMPVQRPATHDQDASPSARTQTPDSLPARISEHARATPNALALDDGAAQLTYGRLETRANRLAGYLRSSGIGAEGCVALWFDRSVDFVVAALAVMKAGAAYLPLDSNTPAERAEFILANSGAAILLTHRNKAMGLNTPGCRHVAIEDLPAPQPGERSEILPGPPTPASLAYVIYTSGSTGRPKGVEITHANLLHLIHWHQHAFAVTAADRASQVAGLAFDATVWELWPYLAAGASVHIADDQTRRSPGLLRDWIIDRQITIGFAPTVLAEQLLHAHWPTPLSLRMLLTGADTLHLRPTIDLPFKLVNNYGPTECTVVATSGIVAPRSATDSRGTAPLDAAASPQAFDSPSIGRPIADTTVLILDPQLRPVAAGEPGELCLAGPHVGRGYRNDPAQTAAAFVTYSPAGGPAMRIYRTGDRARLLANGEIAFMGRLDDQVKLRGYRVELGEIVGWLNRIPGVQASMAAVREIDGTPVLVAYVALAPEARLSGTDLCAFLAARLPEYMVPEQYVKLATFPLTSNGKLDKAALPAPSAENLLEMSPAGRLNADRNPPSAATAPPETASTGELEAKIAALVAGLLEQPDVAREDNFFMLGGHSMLGVQLVARIRDTLGVKLTLRQLFMAPTVAALSAEVARLTNQPR